MKTNISFFILLFSLALIPNSRAEDLHSASRGFTFELSTTEWLVRPHQKNSLEIWIKPLKEKVGPFVVRTGGDLTGIKPQIVQDPENKHHLSLILETQLQKAQERPFTVSVGTQGRFEKKELVLKIIP